MIVMTNINFNYWLQGYFEIIERSSTKPLEHEINPFLDEGQVACIREHLELVKKSEYLAGFAAWLEGYIDAKVGQVGGELGTQSFLIIADKLKCSFQQMTQHPQFPGIAPGAGSFTLASPLTAQSILTC